MIRFFSLAGTARKSAAISGVALAALAVTSCGGSGGDDLPTTEQVACETLAGTTIAGGQVRSATAVAAGPFTPEGQLRVVGDLPAFCRLQVTMQPSGDSNVNVEVWMPRANWNGRYLGTGNGGGAGAIAYGTGMAQGLKRGFAVANTDLGTSPGAAAHMDRPERWKDFGYRANHEMTVAAKTLIQAYYRGAPKSSYFSGCSTGGQQALSIAQRYPDDYDGIIAGAPANNRTHLHAMFAYSAQQLTAPGAAINLAKANLITSRVLAACVGKDGGAPTDTYLTDPRQCRFDPETLPKCSGTEDSDSCVTTAQLTALKAVWSGPVNPRTNERIFAGTPVGSENNGFFGLPFFLSPSVQPTQLYMFNWALGADWKFTDFDRDSQMDAVDAKLAGALNANSADYSRFFERGGKLMMFSGTVDAGVPFADTLAHYERIVEARGGSLAGTLEAARYYMVPGMGHCSSITGGPGVGDFGQAYSSFVPKDKEHDMLLQLVDWFENRKAPEKIIAAKYSDAAGTTAAFERPLCAYPQIPVFQGGDATKASSFQCKDAPRHGVPAPATRYLN